MVAIPGSPKEERKEGRKEGRKERSHGSDPGSPLLDADILGQDMMAAEQQKMVCAHHDHTVTRTRAQSVYVNNRS